MRQNQLLTYIHHTGLPVYARLIRSNVVETKHSGISSNVYLVITNK